MCELFAMSSRICTDARRSLQAFARHGGLEGPHRDGWGLAYYEDGDVRLVKEPEPAFASSCLRYLDEHPFRTQTVLAHIRRATQGRASMRNCQPFARELGGRMHVFAHNGDLGMSALRQGFALGAFRPVGDTDSEHAFCALLERMRPLWSEGAAPPLEARLGVVAGFAAALRALGPANFLYSDGDALFVHSHRRMQADRSLRPPGLHLLSRECAGGQEVVLCASVPLTAEPGWQACREGELAVARAGRIVASVRPG